MGSHHDMPALRGLTATAAPAPELAADVGVVQPAARTLLGTFLSTLTAEERQAWLERRPSPRANPCCGWSSRRLALHSARPPLEAGRDQSDKVQLVYQRIGSTDLDGLICKASEHQMPGST